MVSVKKWTAAVLVAVMVIIPLSTGCKAAGSRSENHKKTQVEEKKSHKKNEEKKPAEEEKAAENEKSKDGEAEASDTVYTEAGDQIQEKSDSRKENVQPTVREEGAGSPEASERKKVWVVDRPAWTETVEKIRSETRYRPTWWINVDGNVTTYYSREEWIKARERNRDEGIPSSWGNGNDEAYMVDVPYTEQVEHKEEGHYEYR